MMESWAFLVSAELMFAGKSGTVAAEVRQVSGEINER